MGMTRKGNCLNFGNCAKADRKELLELGITEDFVCPECGSDLNEVLEKKSGGNKKVLVIAGVVVVLALIGGGTFFALSGGGDETADPMVEQSSLNDDASKIAVQAVNLDTSEKALKVGETFNLTATVSPSDATDQSLQWSSADNGIATVSDGLVTAVASGITEVKASLPDGSLSAFCKITVGAADSKPAKIKAPASTSQNGSLTLDYGSYKGEIKNGKAHGMGSLYYNKHHLISPRDRQERYAEAGDYLVGEFYNGDVVQGKLFDKDNNQKQTVIVGRPN